MTDKNSKPMEPEAAQRIQSHADRTGTNQDFKARAQGAAATNGGAPAPQPATPKTDSGKK